MTVKNCEKLEKSEAALTIEVGAEEFETAVAKAYRKKGREIRVPGFRPGKAPRHLIEKMYGAEVFYADAIDNVWFEAYKAAVEEKELRIVGEPSVEMVGEVTKDGFTFKATVPVYPDVELGEYKNLKAPKAKAEVTDADVDAKIAELTERNTRLVSADKALENGDVAELDYSGTEHGKAFDGGTAENQSLEIGSGTFVPGFEEQLVGMRAGEEKDIDVTFPENYHKDLAGKTVVFHVKVNEVKTKDVPKLDDEFAKDVSEFDTLEDLRADLRRKLTEEREEAAQKGFEDELMKQVAENITCEVPEAMVNAQASRFVDNFRNQIQSQGISFDQYTKLTGMDEAKLLEDAKEPALRQVRVDLALAAIIEKEKVTVTDEEIEADYKRMSDKYGMELDMVKKYLQKETVEDQVKTQKAIDIVTGSAVATEPEEEKKAPGKAKKPDAQKADAAGEEAAGEKKPAEKKTASKSAGEKKAPVKKTARKAEESD